MEGILLDTMFDLPGSGGIEEVVVNREAAEQRAKPFFIYSDCSHSEEMGRSA